LFSSLEEMVGAVVDSDVRHTYIVYDVAKFLDEHPGGEEVIVAEAGE